MIIYFIKSLFLSLLFYGFYVSFLKGMKNFAWNRNYLLCSVILFMLLPLIYIPVITPLSVSDNTVFMSDVRLKEVIISGSPSVLNKDSLFVAITFIYFAGLSFGLFRLIYAFYLIVLLKVKSTREHYQKYSIYTSDSNEHVFSFLKSIFLPDGIKNHPHYNVIIKHEVAHILYRHSYDKILINIAQCLFWFNPVVYWIHRELELIHEYQADEYAQSDMDKDEYAALLVQQSQQFKNPNILIQSFYKHPIKNRIIMLYKQSQNKTIFKLLSVVLLLISSVGLITAQTYDGKKDKKALYDIKTYPKDTILVELSDGELIMQVVQRNPDTIYNKPNVYPEFYGGEAELFKYLQENIKYPEQARQEKLQGKVLTEFFIDKDGNIKDVQVIKSPEKGELLAKEAIRVVQNMPKWKPGKHNQRPVNVRYFLPIVFQLD